MPKQKKKTKTKSAYRAVEEDNARSELIRSLRQALYQAESPEHESVTFEYKMHELCFEFDETGEPIY